MKRIIIATGIFAPDIGGPATVAAALGAGLKGDAEVIIITYSDVRSMPEDRQRPYRVVRIWRRLPWGLRHIVYFFAVAARARSASCILALNALTAGLPAAVAARLLGTRLVVRLPGDIAWEMAVLKGATHLLIDDFQKVPRTGMAKFRHGVQSWVCRQADTVIALSEYFKGIVIGWGIPAEKIVIVNNGVAPAAGEQMPKEEARKRIGIAGNILLSVGRMVPWKGFRMLIKVMPELLQTNQFFRLVIVGDGPDRAMLQSVVRTLGLERKVFLVGEKNRQELAVYLSAADMLVLNTGFESFSNTILEAMAAGVPVVTTYAGSNREVIVQGINGFMVRYHDEFNLVQAILTLWRNKDLQAQFIEEGKRTAGSLTSGAMIQKVRHICMS